MFSDHPLMAAAQDFIVGLEEVLPVVESNLGSCLSTGTVTMRADAHPAVMPHQLGHLRFEFSYSADSDARIMRAREIPDENDPPFPDGVFLHCCGRYFAPAADDLRAAARRLTERVLSGEPLAFGTPGATGSVLLIERHPFTVAARTSEPAITELQLVMRQTLALPEVHVRDWTSRGRQQAGALRDLYELVTGHRPG